MRSAGVRDHQYSRSALSASSMESKTRRGRFALGLPGGVDAALRRLILQLYRTGVQIESRHLRHGLLVLKELIGGDHGDAVPGADLVTERTADAAGEIDGADLKDDFVARARDDVD